jgi:hypothetical protein
VDTYDPRFISCLNASKGLETQMHFLTHQSSYNLMPWVQYKSWWNRSDYCCCIRHWMGTVNSKR